MEKAKRDEGRRTYQRWLTRVRDVLNGEWDPIGCGCPPDEYDQYAGRVAAMMLRGASDDDLIEYLHWAETERMGLDGDEERLNRLRRTIAALRAAPLEG